MHLTDDDLIQHFYAERQAAADREARSATAEHLQACASCRDVWMELSETLKLVDEAPAPNPAAGFEQRLWARVQQQMTQAPGAIGGPKGPPYEGIERPRPRVRWIAWAVPVAGLAAAVAIVTLNIVRHAPPAPVESSVAVAPVPAATDPAADARRSRERVLWSAAEDHLEQTEVLLVELMNSRAPNASDFSFARLAADDLVASGRLYRQTAEQSGNRRLAGVLQDVENVLVEVARSPERIGKKDFELLRARIGGDSLLFKVRAVSNEIRERQKQSLTVAEGAL
jgi:hypothetical protein